MYLYFCGLILASVYVAQNKEIESGMKSGFAIVMLLLTVVLCFAAV